MTFTLKLQERVNYLLRPVPRYLRDLGYIRELKGLELRRRRCYDAWQPHLEQTRSLIIEAAHRCERKRAALIVGTGLLFDIPLPQLSETFSRVVLVDIAHLWKPRREAMRFANVELVACDVTGSAEDVWRRARKRQLPLPLPAPAAFLDESFDLVVSANIASQLPVQPNNYIARRVPEFTRERVNEFSRCLVQQHLHWLCSFSANVCLIADLERRYHEGETIVSREGSLWGLTLPPGYVDWRWDLAPRPEMDLRYDISHRVAGYVEFPKQSWLTSPDSLPTA